MTRTTSYERLVLIATLLAIALYAVADARLAVLVLGAPVAVTGLLLTRGGQGWSMPRFVSGLLVVGAVANAFRTASIDGVDVSDFSEFMVLILLIKCFDRRLPRDDSQLITLCAFLAIGATLLSPALIVGALLVAFLPVFVLLAMQYQLYAGRFRAAEATRGSARRDGAGPLGTAQLLGVTGMSLVLAFVVSAVVFVLVPRGLGRSVFGDWTRTNASSVTGFTDRVQLGGEGVISESTRPVLEVTVLDEDGERLGDEGRLFYLRGAALDVYRGGTWITRSGGMLPAPNRAEPGRVVPIPGVARQVDTLTMRVQMREPAGSRTPIFGLWRPMSVKLGTPGRLSYSPVDFALSFEPERGEVLLYEVRSATELLSPRDTRSGRTPASFDSEVVRQRAEAALLVGEIEADPGTRPVGDDEIAARLIERYLQTNFGYTLRMVSPPVGEDPIDWFLTERDAGHCEYFASAMAAMCRSVGINARVVTGYVAAEFDPTRGSYLVRESNAHAWVEAEVAPGLWRVFDPTPQAELREIHVPKLGLLARVGRFFDSLENAWISSIIGFDESTRSRILGVDEAQSGDRIGGSWLTRALRGDASRWMQALASGAVAFVVIALGGLGLVALGRRIGLIRRQGRGDAVHAWHGSPYYAEALALLEDHDLGKPAGEPLARFAAGRLSEVDADLAAAAGEIARFYYRERFAGAALDATAQQAAGEAVDRLRVRLGLLDR